jgi:monoamine oxidase
MLWMITVIVGTRHSWRVRIFEVRDRSGLRNVAGAEAVELIA